jgi:hypothetical protein
MAEDSITPSEKGELAQLALLTANDKARTLDVVRALLRAAEEQCRTFQACHSTWSNDPAVNELKEKVMKLSWEVPGYNPTPLALTAGITEEQYEYYNGNDIWRLRGKDLGSRGIAFDEDSCIDDIPWEDPLDTYKRLMSK